MLQGYSEVRDELRMENEKKSPINRKGWSFKNAKFSILCQVG